MAGRIRPPGVAARSRHAQCDQAVASACVQARRSARGTCRSVAAARRRRRSRGMTYVFWVSALLIGYVYVGYPALLAVWVRIRPRGAERTDRSPKRLSVHEL